MNEEVETQETVDPAAVKPVEQVVETIPEELPTNNLEQTVLHGDGYTLLVEHSMTVGDMLVVVSLIALLIVTLLVRLVRINAH